MQAVGRCRSRNLQFSIRDIMKGNTIHKIATLSSHRLSETWAPEQPHSPISLVSYSRCMFYPSRRRAMISIKAAFGV